MIVVDKWFEPIDNYDLSKGRLVESKDSKQETYMYVLNPLPVSNSAKIKMLKKQLAESDYKIIKCMECQLAGEDLPYDIEKLHIERQAIRDEINLLEGK